MKYNCFDKEKDFIGSCEICGCKGRLISYKGDQFYRCYTHWFSNEELEKRGFYISEKSKAFGTSNEHLHWSQEDAAWQRALHEHLHVPQFYGEKPNWDKLNSISWDLLKYKVSEKEKKIMEKYEDVPF